MTIKTSGFSGEETIIWGAQDAATGKGTLSQGNTTVEYTGKGTGNGIKDTLALAFSTTDTQNEQVLELQGSVDMGAGALIFENGKWKLTETAAGHTLSSAGLEIKNGAELTWALTGTSSEEIRKVGEGILNITGSGANEAKLVVGGGTTIYNVTRDAAGNITGCTLGNKGETRLNRTGGYAASSVRLEGGVAIVVLMGDDQIKTNSVAGDTFSFGNDGGLLNLNGHDLSWAVINQVGSGTGARIGNFTPEGETTPGKATFTYTGTDTFAGCFMDEGTNGAQLAVKYSSSGNTWKLTGNSTNAGGYTVEAGTLVLEGTNTPHAQYTKTDKHPPFTDTDDWTYASMETSGVKVESGAKFQISHHALFKGDVIVENGGAFELNETVNAESESISGSTRQDMASLGIASMQGKITLNGTAAMTVDTDSPVATIIDSNITGGTQATITKEGTGTLQLEGDGTEFSGSVSVEAGRLVLGTRSAIGSQASLSVSDNATLDLSTIDFTANSAGLELAAGGKAIFESNATVIFGELDSGTTYNIFNLGSSASLTGWTSLQAENIVVNGERITDMRNASIALDSSGTFTYTADRYDLVWSGAATGGTWNRNESNTAWTQVINGTPEANSTYYVNYDNVIFNSTTSLEVDDKVAADTITVADSVTLTLTTLQASGLSANEVKLGSNSKLVIGRKGDVDQGDVVLKSVTGANATLELQSTGLMSLGDADVRNLKFSLHSLGDTSPIGTLDITGKVVVSETLSIGWGTMNIGPDAEVTSKALNASTDGKKGESVININGGKLTITGTNDDASGNTDFILAFWHNGSGALNLNAGSLTAEDTSLLMGFDSPGTFNATGGSATLKGIRFRNNLADADTFNLGTNNAGTAVVTIGANGIEGIQSNDKVNLGEGTLKASANFSISGDAIHLIGTIQGTAIDTNEHTVTINAAVKGSGILNKTGKGTLVMANTAHDFDGSLDVQQGTLAFETAAAGMLEQARSVSISGGTLQVEGDALNSTEFKASLNGNAGCLDLTNSKVQVDYKTGIGNKILMNSNVQVDLKNVQDTTVIVLSDTQDNALSGAMKGGSLIFAEGRDNMTTNLAVDGTSIYVDCDDADIQEILKQTGKDYHTLADLDHVTGTTNGVYLGSYDDASEAFMISPLYAKYFTNLRLNNGEIQADRVTNYYTGSAAQVGLSPNGLAGLALADAVLVELNPQLSAATAGVAGQQRAIAPASALAKMLDAMDAAMAAGNTSELDELGAALAGASTAVLGMAAHGDLDRQLQAIRNRTTTMGVEQNVVHHDMPYFNAWINAEGDYSELSDDGTEGGYKLNSWGGTVGFDVDITPTFTAGMALTAMYVDLDVTGADTASGELNTYYVSAFARYCASAWTHTFVATAGLSDITLDRTVMGEKLEGETDGVSFGFMYEVGRVFALDEDGTACLQPIFNVAYRHTQVNGYEEDGSDLALEVGDQTLDTVTFGVGARLQAIVGESMYNRTSIFECRLLAKFDAGDRQGSSENGLVVLPGVDEEVESAERGGFGLEAGAGLTIPLGDEGGSLFMDASVELRADYTNVNGTVGYRVNF